MSGSARIEPFARLCGAWLSTARFVAFPRGTTTSLRPNPRIGVLSPTPDAIIAAHARKTGATIERPELDAANRLGLTTQVVARAIYRTNLFPRELHIGGQRIKLQAAGPRSLARDADPAELVIDALQALGKAHITDAAVSKLREFVKDNGLTETLRKRARRGPSWMLPIIDRIVSEDLCDTGAHIA